MPNIDAFSYDRDQSMHEASDFEAMSLVLGCIIERQRDLREQLDDRFPDFRDQDVHLQLLESEEGSNHLVISSADGENGSSITLNILYFPDLERKQRPYETILNQVALNNRLTITQSNQIKRAITQRLQELSVKGKHTTLQSAAAKRYQQNLEAGSLPVGTATASLAERSAASNMQQEQSPLTRAERARQRYHGTETANHPQSSGTNEPRPISASSEIPQETPPPLRRVEEPNTANPEKPRPSQENQTARQKPTETKPAQQMKNTSPQTPLSTPARERQSFFTRVFPTTKHSLAFVAPVAAATVASAALSFAAIENITLINRLSYSVSGMGGEASMAGYLRLLACMTLPGLIGGTYLGTKAWQWVNERVNTRPQK